MFFLRPLLLTIQPENKKPTRWVISNLWARSLFGERVKKSRREGMERVRSRACRQTLGTAIPPSCLVIADHLSARSLCVTWIHWYVISFASKKGVGRQQTAFTSCQNTAFSNEFLLWRVDYVLDGLV